MNSRSSIIPIRTLGDIRLLPSIASTKLLIAMQSDNDGEEFWFYSPAAPRRGKTYYYKPDTNMEIDHVSPERCVYSYYRKELEADLKAA